MDTQEIFVDKRLATPSSTGQRLRASCAVLMQDVGEAANRVVAGRALQMYSSLPMDEKRDYFEFLLHEFGVDDDALIDAYGTWERTRDPASLADLFEVVEPARQELLRRLNHAPGGTSMLVDMRADLLTLIRDSPELHPLDRDFRHLLSSWFNRGFLRLEEIHWDGPESHKQHILEFETVHPMRTTTELSARLRPADRRIFAFFHPATGDIPLIFVEVALTREIATDLDAVLASNDPCDPAQATTAVLYSINNSLRGLAGISFGHFLIKQVIDSVRDQLPGLTTFVTLSPLPGFRAWLDATEDPVAAAPRRALSTHDHVDTVVADESTTRAIQAAAAHYVAEIKHHDGRPRDPVARFHLGNGAVLWQTAWPASRTDYQWDQSYGAMVVYRYELEHLETRHENYIRRKSITVGTPALNLLTNR